ncbi:hypothetical protein HAZT_HAZT000774 [Hyalella azteca]|uniref:E3 ubiquitin-protein ligase n=1 Tax=Hyalella azteca TaxID=294128 RepID=A0A6A0GS20_HYAAZ|nr:hypothetical protein HAZT_HAZT000774 [Hyalella azteca]
MDESMCQGAAGSDESKNLLVVGVMVQPSTVLARRRREFNTLDQPLYLPADLHRGIHVSSCGHPMHVHCWKLYYIKVIQKEQRRNYRMRQGTNIDVERSEYLCPLCECICNDAVPLLPPPTQPLFGGSITQGDILVTPQQWLHGLHVIHTNKVARTVHASAPELSDSLSDEEDSTAVAGVWLPPDLPSVTSRLTSDMNSSCAASNFLKMFTSEYNTTMSNLLPTSDQVMWDFAHSIFRHGLDQNPNLADERILGCTLASLAYTIRSHEEVQRYEGRALLTGISSRQHLFLSSLTATAAYIPSNQCSKQMPQVSTSAAVCVLRDVLGASSVTLLEMDCFSAAVSLVLLLPGIFSPTHATAKGGLQDQYVLQLCFLGHIVQLLLTYDRTFPEDQTPMEDTDEVQEAVLGSWVAAEEEDPMDKECEDSSGSEHDASWLLALFHQSRDAVGLPPLHVNAATLLAHIKERCLPFLRCAGLFFHLLTGCAAPAELSSSVWVPESEYYCLLRYLGLSTSLAQSLQPFASVVKVWLAHPRLLKCLKVPTFDGDRALTVNKLYPLLKDYSEFISEVASFACPSSTVGEKSSTPTICLVCGTMMCSQTYCCQTELPDATKQMVGATTAHAHTCCAGSGMFLRVWDCTVIFRTGKYKARSEQYGRFDLLFCCMCEGCYFTPPYLDQYGEADMGLRRGNPLFLNAESYSRLHAKWLQHLIPETVSRTLAAASTHVFSIDWQHV